MVIHLLAAVRAIHKFGKRICHAEGVDTLRRFSQLLSQFPGLPVYNRLMGIPENQPVPLRIGDAGLILAGFLLRPEVDRMRHILRFGNNMPDNKAAPVIRAWKFISAFPDTLVLLTKVNGGRLHLIIIEDADDFIRAVALDGRAEYPADNCRRFLVDQTVALVLRVFPVPIDGIVGGVFAGFALHTDSSFLLAAQVTEIPLVTNIIYFKDIIQKRLRNMHNCDIIILDFLYFTLTA